MKILITADLHYREQWFGLLSRAAEWDLVCIAGDLLDMFNDFAGCWNAMKFPKIPNKGTNWAIYPGASVLARKFPS